MSEPLAPFGMKIVESPHLGLEYPDHREDARRNIRHLMSDVLEWLGEPVGLKPGEPTEPVFIVGDTIFAGPGAVARIKGISK